LYWLNIHHIEKH